MGISSIQDKEDRCRSCVQITSNDSQLDGSSFLYRDANILLAYELLYVLQTGDSQFFQEHGYGEQIKLFYDSYCCSKKDIQGLVGAALFIRKRRDEFSGLREDIQKQIDQGNMKYCLATVEAGDVRHTSGKVEALNILCDEWDDYHAATSRTDEKKSFRNNCLRVCQHLKIFMFCNVEDFYCFLNASKVQCLHDMSSKATNDVRLAIEACVIYAIFHENGGYFSGFYDFMYHCLLEACCIIKRAGRGVEGITELLGRNTDELNKEKTDTELL